MVRTSLNKPRWNDS